jgi:hypothetical protein
MFNKKLFDYEINTDLCQFCNQIDVLQIDQEHFDNAISRSKLDIASFVVYHDKEEHEIVHYLSSKAEYLGYEIPALYLKEIEERHQTILNSLSEVLPS